MIKKIIIKKTFELHGCPDLFAYIGRVLFSFVALCGLPLPRYTSPTAGTAFLFTLARYMLEEPLHDYCYCCFEVLYWDRVLHVHSATTSGWGETAWGHLSVPSDGSIDQQQHQPSSVRRSARSSSSSSPVVATYCSSHFYG